MTRMLSTDEARTHIGVSRVTLRQAMLATPPHIHRPWSCYGGEGASVRYPVPPRHDRH